MNSMLWRVTLLFLSLYYSSPFVEPITVVDNIIHQSSNRFPDEFLFGSATAAYQIEGGWNVDGKGPSIWDQFTHDHPDRIKDHSNADVGANSYRLYKDDIKALKDTGVNFYRFSIAWSRILPDGDVSSLNPIGIKYYNDLINELIENNIEPMVTMYHYDLPQNLQNLGGLINPKVIDYFEEYSNVLYSNFGDRVKRWITFNEPFDFCSDGYGDATSAPLVYMPGIGEYYCIDHVVKSHARAYHLYQQSYKKKFGGKVGITLSSRFFYSSTNDTDVIDRAMQYQLGWITHPIFSQSGGYPPIMVEEIASNSVREGRAWSRLPAMSVRWKKYIKGSADFFGLNYYTSRFVKSKNTKMNSTTLVQIIDKPQGHNPSWDHDVNLEYLVDPNWKRAKSSWLYLVPQGLGDLLRWIRDEYNNPEVIVTENGWSDDGELEDVGRIEYLREHLKQVLTAVNEDGCNVSGYTVWSIIDNFEWLLGFTEKFGMFSVDLNSTNKKRTPKKSVEFYRTVIQTKEIP